MVGIPVERRLIPHKIVRSTKDKRNEEIRDESKSGLITFIL